MSQKRKHDENEERFFVDQYADYLDVPKNAIEHPISSIKQKQLTNGQSMPDAIFYCKDGTKIVEVTTFSRSQKMRKQMGAITKYPERFPTIIDGISMGECDPLAYELYKAIAKKINKKYDQCAMLCGATSKDLVVGFINNDTFMTKAAFDQLVRSVKHEPVLFSWKVDLSNFDTIILMAYAMDHNNQWAWYTIVLVDPAMMSRLREWRVTRTKILADIDQRNLTHQKIEGIAIY